MIPKKIHYCWLSDEEIPSGLQECIASWKAHMPDYEIIRWNMERFDINSVQFVKEACSVKQWAFAADYIRLYALYMEGGIYLDTDVLVKKSFNTFLEHDFFSAIEIHPKTVLNEDAEQLLTFDGSSINPGTSIPGIGIQAAIMGGIKGHKLLQEGMSYYENKNFLIANGQYNDKIIAPSIFAITAEKFGFKYKDKLQELSEDMTIYPSQIFSDYDNKSIDSYAIHLGAGGWRKKTRLQKITGYLKTSTMVRKICLKSKVTILAKVKAGR